MVKVRRNYFLIYDSCINSITRLVTTSGKNVNNIMKIKQEAGTIFSLRFVLNSVDSLPFSLKIPLMIFTLPPQIYQRMNNNLDKRKL